VRRAPGTVCGSCGRSRPPRRADTTHRIARRCGPRPSSSCRPGAYGRRGGCGGSSPCRFLMRYFDFQNRQPAEVFRRGWGAYRWGDTIDSVYWAYNRTGDGRLLDLVRKIHAGSADYVTGLPTLHNVNLAQGFREPIQYGVLADDPALRAATYRNYDAVMGTYGQFPGESTRPRTVPRATPTTARRSPPYGRPRSGSKRTSPTVCPAASWSGPWSRPEGRVRAAGCPRRRAAAGRSGRSPRPRRTPRWSARPTSAGWAHLARCADHVYAQLTLYLKPNAGPVSEPGARRRWPWRR
jgi:hypothetical protein